MNRTIFFILFACFALSNTLLAQSINLNDIIDATKSNGYILLPNNALAKCVEIEEEGIKYSLGLSDDNKVIFISTTDTLFSINGIKTGDCISSFCDVEKIEFECKNDNYTPGWGYYIPIGDGWFAAFNFKEKPNKNSLVQYLFKYNISQQAKFKANSAIGTHRCIDYGDYYIHTPTTVTFHADEYRAAGSDYEIPIPKNTENIRELGGENFIYQLTDNQYIMIIGYSKYDLGGLKKTTPPLYNNISNFFDFLDDRYSQDTCGVDFEVLRHVAETSNRKHKILHIGNCNILLFNINHSEIDNIEALFNKYFKIDYNDALNQEYIKLNQKRQ